jgi:hypothetical protein
MQWLRRIDLGTCTRGLFLPAISAWHSANLREMPTREGAGRRGDMTARRHTGSHTRAHFLPVLPCFFMQSCRGGRQV